MHRYEYNIDYRPLRRGQNADISLWPSFTDIMTVILMIFMLTMIVVIIKNSNLAGHLIFRKAQEQKIQEALDTSLEAQAQLKISITNLEEKLRAKEMEIILLGDEKKVMQSTLEAKLAQISAHRSDMSAIEADVKTLEADLAARTAEVATKEKEKEKEKERVRREFEEKITVINKETKRQIEEFNRKFVALIQQLGQKDELIVLLDAEKRDFELALAKSRRSYLTLEEKYHKLIRPTRSPLDKSVATVQYSRVDGKYRVLFKDPDSKEFIQIDMAQLHNRLEQLKNELQDKLYVKIIIPDKSGLSYNEAWNFTRNILATYDYYYQEKK
jgi:hypothetical protein